VWAMVVERGLGGGLGGRVRSHRAPTRVIR